MEITGSRGIARRYFVTNGFDGALTMLGLTCGFWMSGDVDLPVIFTACVAAAIALGMSGLSSTYVSEEAERKKGLHELEAAMITDLEHSAHGRASTWAPVFIAIISGSAPLMISLVIIVPIWLAMLGVDLPLQALPLSFGIAFLIIFLLGVFLGIVSETFWLWSGLRTLAVAAATSALIVLLAAP